MGKAGVWGWLLSVLAGRRAFTVQSYTEANVKNGIEFDVSTRFATIGAGATVTIGLTTGSKPVLIKSRIITFGGGATELQYSAAHSCTFTGGTAVPAPTNANTTSANTSEVTVVTNPTVTVQGVQYLRPFSIIGSGTWSSKIGTDSSGKGTVLGPNRQHVFTFTNPSAQAATPVFWWLTFYEGTMDLPWPVA